MGSLESLELTMAIPGLNSSSTQGGDVRVCNMRDFDINQPAWGPEEEEFSLRSIEDGQALEDDEEEAGNRRRKKLQLSKDQCIMLEESFNKNQTPNFQQKEALASSLKLKPRQVEVWFQNRRARTKLKQTERECHYLKRFFNSLRAENHRLHHEVEELRALRVAPPTVLLPNTSQPVHASLLTMCPCCQRITAGSNNAFAGKFKAPPG